MNKLDMNKLETLWMYINCPLSYKGDMTKLNALKDTIVKHNGVVQGMCKHHCWCIMCMFSVNYKNLQEFEVALKRDIVATMMAFGRAYTGVYKIEKGWNNTEEIDWRSFKWNDHPTYASLTVVRDWRQPKWFQTAEQKAEAKIRKAIKLDIVGKIFIANSDHVVLVVKESRGWYSTMESYASQSDVELSFLYENRYCKKDVVEKLKNGEWKEKDLAYVVKRGAPLTVLTKTLLQHVGPYLQALEIVAPGKIIINKDT